MSNKTIIIFTILAFALGSVLYLLYPTPNEYKSPDDNVVCTQDALACPDGSYVGRTGPNCEFVCSTLPPGTKMEDGVLNQ
ncbi:MAG: hypothetical protein AAB861_03490 [Patescibacteria group bacterium]